MRKLTLVGAVLLLAGLAGCVPRAETPPPAPPPPPPAPAPEPPPPPPAPPADWRDAPLSAGDWSYRGDGSVSVATYGAGAFELRCGGGQISLVRPGGAGGSLAIRTTFGERNLPARTEGGAAVATLAASDPLLDQIAFSRGRFLVQASGAAPLILPAWPEPVRVIEDCRG